MSVLELAGVPRDYAWGSHTAIQTLLGVPSQGPLAELWFGDHSGDPARVPALDTTLDAVIAADPQALLGRSVVEAYGPHLPFLLKILAADRVLSIQVHPNRAQAQERFAAADPNYTDANHKPELLCALTPFEALCGFRPPEQSAALCQAVGLFDIAAALRGPDPLRAAFTAVLTHDEPAELSAQVAARAAELPVDAARAVAVAAGDFPGDVGVVVTLLLNYVRLEPGQAVYLAAGNVHCYLRGLGVEILAASDNVLRCGLTPKRIDVQELLRITDFTALTDPRWPLTDGSYVPTVPDFRLTPRTVDGPGQIAGAGPRIALCTSGAVQVGDVRLGPARAAFLADGDQCRLDGSGQVFLASVG